MLRTPRFETCAQTGAMLAGADAATQESCRLWGLETGLSPERYL